MSNPREFDGYEAAKKHYDAMLEDRTRYGELNVEIRRLEKQLDRKKIPLTAERKEEIRPDMEAYTRVRDNLESTFMEKYGVKDVRKLADKVREFRAELQDMARNPASEEGQGG